MTTIDELFSCSFLRIGRSPAPPSAPRATGGRRFGDTSHGKACRLHLCCRFRAALALTQLRQRLVIGCFRRSSAPQPEHDDSEDGNADEIEHEQRIRQFHRHPTTCEVHKVLRTASIRRFIRAAPAYRAMVQPVTPVHRAASRTGLLMGGPAAVCASKSTRPESRTWTAASRWSFRQPSAPQCRASPRNPCPCPT